MTVEHRSAEDALRYATSALRLIPDGAKVAVLMRHATRGKIAKGYHGNDVLLTPQGEKDAIAMGSVFSTHRLALFHSPVERCRQTAVGIGSANAQNVSLREWVPLGCGAFMENLEKARPTLNRLVIEDDFYDSFITEMSQAKNTAPYPFFRPPLVATAELISDLMPKEKGMIAIGVTHDWLVNVPVSHTMGSTIERRFYADFLDALFVWELSGDLSYYHKGRTGACAESYQREFARAQRNHPHGYENYV